MSYYAAAQGYGVEVDSLESLIKPSGTYTWDTYPGSGVKPASVYATNAVCEQNTDYTVTCDYVAAMKKKD